MLAEALKSLAELVTKGQTPVKLDVADPRKSRYAVGGNLWDVDLPKSPRAHKPGTLDEVVALANRFAADGETPVVWYDQNAIVLVIDDDGHRVERVTLTLEPSDTWNTLVRLRAKSPALEQKPFLKLLRLELSGTGVEPLIEAVKRLKFENGQVTNSEVTRSKESIGRQATSAVSGEKEIPEQITLATPVWKTPGEGQERFSVRCHVDVDPVLGTLLLLPLADELERVQALAVGGLGDRLRAGLTEGTPCYQGQP